MKKILQSAFPWRIKSIESEGTFRGYASIFHTIDDQGDQILPGAFTQSLQKWRRTDTHPKMLWQHDHSEPIGWWRHIMEDQHGLYVEGQLLLSLRRSQEIYEMLKNQMIDGLSIGCRVIESERHQDHHARCLKSVDLMEISLVTFAANSDAKITHIKSNVPLKTHWVHQEQEARLLKQLQNVQKLIQA